MDLEKAAFIAPFSKMRHEETGINAYNHKRIEEEINVKM